MSDVRRVIYSFTVSLDGFVAGPGGDISWSVPTPELHRLHNERMREVAVQVCGRRLYEVMVYWDRPDAARVAPEMIEFEQIWRTVPKIVFSSTLKSVEGNATLATEDVVDVVRRLRSEPGGPIAVGGAGLAAALIEHDLIDDFRLFVSPVILGAGTPYFPPMRRPLDLELVETRTFDSGMVYLRYVRPAVTD